MGHNRAGDARKRRLKAAKKEQQRLWCGISPDPNPVAPINNSRPGAIHIIPINKIRLTEQTQAKLFVNPRKLSVRQAMRKSLRQAIRKDGTSPIEVVKDGDGYRLIAGERRLLACKQLGYKRIPARIIEVPKIDKRTPDEPDSVTEDRAALVAAFRGNFFSRRFEKME